MSKNRADHGFTIIEVLIAIFVVATTMVGLFGLFVLSIRLAADAENRVVAIALANERAEMVRNLPYVEVGTQGGIPGGTILQEEEIARNDVTYTVRTDIRYVDDPYDGIGGAGGEGDCVTICHVPPGNAGNETTLCKPQVSLDAHFAHGDYAGPCGGGGAVAGDPLNTDFKQVRIAVSWNSVNSVRPVLLVMWVAPQGVEGGELFGTLDFQAMDAQGNGVAGATVTLFNDTVSPLVDITTNTNEEGRVIIPGLPEASESYEISVTKDGYSTEQTYDSTATFFPDVEHSHLSALIGQLTQKTFFIDLVASIDIVTAYPKNRASGKFLAGDGDDYVEIAHLPAYEIDSGSISFWFKADTVTGNQGIWSKDGDGFGTGGHLTMRLNGSTLEVNHQGAGGDNVVQVAGIAEDLWYHVVYTFGAGGMKLYLNAEGPQTNGYNGGLGSNLEPVVVGASSAGSGAGFAEPISEAFSGRIDEVRLYNQELTVGEVQNLKSGEEVVNGLVGHWKLDELSGAVAVDSVAGNDGAWSGDLQFSLDTAFSGGVGEIIGGVTYALQGSKTIGTDESDNAVYLIDESVTTSASGLFNHTELPWDVYTVIINGATEGYDLQATNLILPLTLDPNQNVELNLLLVDHTTRSLLLTVTDESGAALAGAKVKLSDQGIDETRQSSASGQVFFDNLPLNGDYSLGVEITGYQTLNSIIAIEDTTAVTVQLSSS